MGRRRAQTTFALTGNPRLGDTPAASLGDPEDVPEGDGPVPSAPDPGAQRVVDDEPQRAPRLEVQREDVDTFPRKVLADVAKHTQAVLESQRKLGSHRHAGELTPTPTLRL